MAKIFVSIPLAVVVSLILVGAGAVLASYGPWIGKVALGLAVFVGIVYTGAAVRRRQRSR